MVVMVAGVAGEVLHFHWALQHVLQCLEEVCVQPCTFVSDVRMIEWSDQQVASGYIDIMLAQYAGATMAHQRPHSRVAHHCRCHLQTSWLPAGQLAHHADTAPCISPSMHGSNLDHIADYPACHHLKHCLRICMAQ